jgi:hypothetical protein
LVSYVSVVGNVPDNEHQRAYSKNAKHDDHGYDNQDHLERTASLRWGDWSRGHGGRDGSGHRD